MDQQIAAGVTIVSDGELGKVGYSTYMTERLSGFGGDVLRKPALDDIRRFAAAPAGKATRGFMNAASPGLITAFQPNQHYPAHEAYLADLVDAMRPEYKAIVAARFDLQLDCPDLAMSRHTGYQDLTEAEFVKTAAANVEALNAATANLPPEPLRMHVCWGNYEGPHDHDIPLERVVDVILGARPSTILFEAANPRHEHEWAVWAETKIPDTKILAPGLIDTCSNYVEHPELVAQRIERFAAIVGTAALTPISAAGYSAQPWQEGFVKFGFASVGLTIISCSVLVLWGLRRSAAS